MTFVATPVRVQVALTDNELTNDTISVESSAECDPSPCNFISTDRRDESVLCTYSMYRVYRS
jgi:hypothetical protein